MNSIHDMGGMHGFGRVSPEENEPVFHEPWEGRLFAMQVSGMVRQFPSTDAGRHALELLAPADYVSTPYYERWLLRIERRLVELGILAQEELDDRVRYYRERPNAEVPRHEEPAVAERVVQRVHDRVLVLRESGKPARFKVGDAIRTKNEHPKGHHRLPRYARGRRGVISQWHGYHDLADDLARGDHNAEALYSVKFNAAELWGASAEDRASVYLDLWDSYLEAATTSKVSEAQGGLE